MIEFSGELIDWIRQLSAKKRRALGARFDRLQAQGDESGHIIRAEGKLCILLFFERKRKNTVEWHLTYYTAPDGRRLFLTRFREDAVWDDEVTRALRQKALAISAGHSAAHL